MGLAQRQLDDGDLAEFRQKIADSVVNLDLSKQECWSDLSSLSENTVIDDIEVFPEEIIGSRNEFSGAFNVYVTLRYKSFPKGKEGFDAPMAFPGVYKGHIDPEKGTPVIDDLSIDTVSFYE